MSDIYNSTRTGEMPNRQSSTTVKPVVTDVRSGALSASVTVSDVHESTAEPKRYYISSENGVLVIKEKLL